MFSAEVSGKAMMKRTIIGPVSQTISQRPHLQLCIVSMLILGFYDGLGLTLSPAPQNHLQRDQAPDPRRRQRSMTIGR